MEFVVERPGELLEVLVRSHPDASKRTLRKMLTAGRVLVDGEPVHAAKHEVEGGATIQILSADHDPDRPSALGGRTRPTGPEGEGPTGAERLVGQVAAAERARVKVLHEDHDILVLEKPAGLLTLPREGRSEDDLARRATAYMQARRGASLRARRKAEQEVRRGDRPHGARPAIERGGAIPVHALERDASGAVLFAKHEDAKEALQAAMSSGDFVVHHSAVVMGRVDPREGVWDAQVSESATHQVYTTRAKMGDTRVQVRYVVVEDNPWVLWPLGDANEQTTPPTTLIAFTSSSRSSAKNRAALFAVGHPVVGDRQHKWFGDAGPGDADGRNRPRGMRVPDPARRLLLHTSGLSFPHPFTGEPFAVESPLPDRFRGGRRNA